ncbi:endonuclease/exonuclease/phosphatase family protein [Tropicimonas sp. IMCC34043]|uniref:endonuclease/exonuclease/phosphatase family protein n=1 Tax=Tropicimonas sp. IMCC34043 TaxID=2248760 RepID=UPI000E26EBB1|nr:endonuclease/exonuclease/phosphatase family protein [Tropicimonas sp. IMCC34043]
MKIATFNVQNLRLRPAGPGGALDGARDGDLAPDTAAGAEGEDLADRRLTAAVLHGIDADVVALQEVYDRATLDFFHDRFLLPTGMAPYPHRICLPGNDNMGRNLALLSRIAPRRIESHTRLVPSDLDLTPPPGVPADRPIFCRDCLEVELPALWLYLCHFKAPYPDRDRATAARNLEATAVRTLIERRFADPAAARWLVLGDLNEPDPRAPEAALGIAPLLGGFSVDLLERRPKGQRWSYRDPLGGNYSRPDALLASPALAAAFPGAMPRVVREGLGEEVAAYPGPRLHGVGRHRPHASDHAALAIAFDGLGTAG